MTCLDTSGGRSEPKVLLVLAEREFRRAVLQLLTEDGIPVLGEVTSGSGAISAVMAPRPEAPDVVVAGGRLNGLLPIWDVIRGIREVAPAVETVVVLGDTDGEVAERCRQERAFAVLDRAGSPAALLEAVRWAGAEHRDGKRRAGHAARHGRSAAKSVLADCPPEGSLPAGSLQAGSVPVTSRSAPSPPTGSLAQARSG